MPTVILLDNSLSMCKYATTKKEKSLTKRELSHLITRRYIEHISKIDSYEYVALIAYSSTAEIVSKFTREYTKIFDSLDKLKIGDCACIEEGLNKVSDIVVDEWACYTNIQVLLITNDIDNLHYGSVKNVCNRLKDNKVLLKDYYLSNGIDFDPRIHFKSILNDDIFKFNFNNKKNYYNLKYPFSFPNKFNIISLTDNYETDESEEHFLKIDDLSKMKSLMMYDKKISHHSFDEENFKLTKLQFSRNLKLFYLNELLELNNTPGYLYITKLNEQKFEYMDYQFFKKIFNDIIDLKTFELKCGHLESSITLIPSPITYKGFQNNIYVERNISKNLEICGFINMTDLVTPPTISTHMITLTDEATNEKISETSENSLSILLHASLKSERMAAIVYFENDWYGAIQSYPSTKNNETKKRYNFVMNIFTPGHASIQDIIIKISHSGNQSSKNFPIKSYSKGCIVWYRPDNLVSDLQKVIRSAKKMQDKMPIFYKELNKVRKAALSFGFYELFEGLAQMLQRELNNNSNMNNQELIVQLNHTIYCLRAQEYKEFRKDIIPYSTMPRKIHK